MADKRVVFFTVSGQTYGLDVSYTQGIEKFVNLLPVPNTLSHIKGLITLRGEVIPIYSLRKKFGLPETKPTDATQLIITRLQSGISLAFEVDGVREIVEISEDAETIAPALVMSGDTKYIEKVVHLKQSLAILINPEGILTDEEKENIEKYLEKLKKEALKKEV
ncbi:MAG: chemotaxis protein CheW [Acetivibrio sp.]